MSYKLHSWAVNKHLATTKKAAYAHVTIRGYHKGLLRKTWKSEAYNIPLDTNDRKNTNEALVKQSIKLSANRWSILWGTNFK